jgi:hypothetical protein
VVQIASAEKAKLDDVVQIKGGSGVSHHQRSGLAIKNQSEVLNRFLKALKIDRIVFSYG